jgi:hypothetical protein
VDEFLTLIIFFIVIGVVERVLRAARKAKGEPPIQREAQPHDEGAIEGLPASLQDLIAEELGINLERKPRIEGPPEPLPPPTARAAPAEHPGRRLPPSAHPAPPPVPLSRERVVQHPSARREEPERGRERAGDRIAALARARREATARRRRGPAPTRRPLHEPERPPSLEERAILERGEPVSIERPRRPEDHERFHDRYMGEEAGPAVRRRRRGPLPDRWDWSAAQKAIIWAEILGPPKGLED